MRWQVWRYEHGAGLGPSFAIERASGRQSFLGGQTCVADCETYDAAAAALRLMKA